MVNIRSFRLQYLDLEKLMIGRPRQEALLCTIANAQWTRSRELACLWRLLCHSGSGSQPECVDDTSLGCDGVPGLRGRVGILLLVVSDSCYHCLI